MKHISILSIILTIVFGSCNPETVQLEQFRGPDRSGIYASESSLSKQWPEDGPTEVFFIDSIGDGYGSPVIAGDLMYFTGAEDSLAILNCYDLDGNRLWQLELGMEWITNYPGSRSAPTVTENLLYTGTGFGNLYCVDIQKKELVWSKKLDEDFGGVLPRFGHSESPFVHGEKVFWTAGGSEHNVLAINRYTGDIIWSSAGMKERSAYHPPRVITAPGGREILVTFSAYHLMGLDVETGDLLWTHEQDNYPVSEHKPGIGDTHANTVIYDEGSVYYAAGDGNCGVKLSLSSDGTTISESWRNTGFDSYMGGIVKIGDHIYGSGTMKSQIRSIHATTGVLTDSLKIGRGVVIAADNMIYYYSQNGSMYLIAYDNGKMEEVSSFRIRKGTREHFAHPIIYDGILYVRHGRSMMGYDIKAIS